MYHCQRLTLAFLGASERTNESHCRLRQLVVGLAAGPPVCASPASEAESSEPCTPVDLLLLLVIAALGALLLLTNLVDLSIPSGPWAASEALLSL